MVNFLKIHSSFAGLPLPPGAPFTNEADGGGVEQESENQSIVL
jgi:hypothetical protein